MNALLIILAVLVGGFIGWRFSPSGRSFMANWRLAANIFKTIYICRIRDDYQNMLNAFGFKEETLAPACWEIAKDGMASLILGYAMDEVIKMFQKHGADKHFTYRQYLYALKRAQKRAQREMR